MDPEIKAPSSALRRPPHGPPWVLAPLLACPAILFGPLAKTAVVTPPPLPLCSQQDSSLQHLGLPRGFTCLGGVYPAPPVAEELQVCRAPGLWPLAHGRCSVGICCWLLAVKPGQQGPAADRAGFPGGRPGTAGGHWDLLPHPPAPGVPFPLHCRASLMGRGKHSRRALQIVEVRGWASAPW